ncbi:MAG TPA: N4-gp56 family major capsid protein [Terriglobales bacterium]|nr:N4-gp56 family major capsid protein [Terriglobales bacterium]
MGDSANDIIQIRDETQKSAGDKITFGLRMQLTGAGVLGDGTLEGNEESLVTYNDAVFIDQLRHSVRSGGRMSQQRVPFSVRDEALSGLRDWWTDRFDTAAFNQFCGYTPQADVRFTGNQATLAPDANHYLNQGNHADDSGIVAGDVYQLSLIDRAIEAARTLTPAIRPTMIGGKPFWVVFIHPYQTTDLRTNTATGQWLDIQKAAMTGGEIEDNPIFDGSLGVYNGAIIHEDVRVTPGAVGAVSYPNVRRALMCGAQSLALAFGRDGGPNRYTWVEELFDYENQLGVAAGSIFGMKKTRFNGADFGTIVTSSYAVKH